MLKKMYTRDLFLPTLNIDDLITGKLKEMSNETKGKYLKLGNIVQHHCY